MPTLNIQPIVLSSQGYHLLADGVTDMDIRAPGYDPDELTAFLKNKAGWASTGGHALGEQGAGFARLNIACTHSILNAALNQLESAV